MSQAGILSSSGIGTSDVKTLTGNSGGAVGPDGAFNIGLVGTATNGINIVGTPASNLLTISMQSPFSGVFKFDPTGTATTVTDVLTIENKVNAAAMTGTGEAILFNQWYYDAVTPAVADAGRIAVITEGNWTSTASTQDSYMSLQTCLDGTVTEHWRITSGGILSDFGASTDASIAGMQIAGTTGADQLMMFGKSGGAGSFTSMFLQKTADTSGNFKWGSFLAGGGTAPESQWTSFTADYAVAIAPNTGSVTTNTAHLKIQNIANASSMAGTETSILWQQYYYDAVTPLSANSGRLSFGADGNWTSTNSTRDSSFLADISIAGTLTRKLLLGKLGMVLGTPATEVSRAHLGLTIANSNATTFATDTDIGDTNRSLGIFNSNSASNSFSSVTLRNGVTGSGDIIDLKLVGNSTDVNSSKLVYTWSFNGTPRDVLTMTSQGGLAYRPTATNDIVAGTGITNAMLARNIRIQGSGGAVNITANPQIAAGLDGQMITFIGQSDTNTVTFDTGNGLKLNAGSSMVLGQGDTFTLVYDSGLALWLECSRSNNA